MRRKLSSPSKNTSSLTTVIPSEIVEDMDLKKGDKLDFSIEEDYIKAKPIKAKRE